MRLLATGLSFLLLLSSQLLQAAGAWLLLCRSPPHTSFPYFRIHASTKSTTQGSSNDERLDRKRVASASLRFSSDSNPRPSATRQIATPTSSNVNSNIDSNNSLTAKPSSPHLDTTTAVTRRINGLDLPYASTIRALEHYHSLHGDLALPRRFVVPENEGYPKEWIGLDLSTAVYDMKWWQRNVKERPARVSELNQLGFVWERLQPEWNIILGALITFHGHYGHVMVPYQFVVPSGNEQLWPKATWGISLGNCVYRIRRRHDFVNGANGGSRRSQLDSLGFVWDVNEHKFLKFFAVLRHYAKLECVGCYSGAEGSSMKPLRVPSTFVVPDDDSRWPPELYGYPLGAKCAAVRQKQLYLKNEDNQSDRQQMLLELGFRFAGNANLGWLKVSHASAIYSQLHNRTLDVPYKFVVPEPLPQGGGGSGGDWPWPEYLWGLPLGQRLKDIRLTGAYLKGADGESRRRQLEALGFIWNQREHRFRIFYAALQRYAQLHKMGKYGTTPLSVPCSFCVPENNEHWPSELWKYELGKKASTVRNQGVYLKGQPERQQLLIEIGFLPKDYSR